MNPTFDAADGEATRQQLTLNTAIPALFLVRLFPRGHGFRTVKPRHANPHVSAVYAGIA